MDFEEPRQQRARGLGHVRTLAAFDLREIGLADGTASLRLNRLQQFLLGHGTIEAAQRALHFPQVTNLLGQLHIADRDYNIAICDACQELNLECFLAVACGQVTLPSAALSGGCVRRF